MSDIDIAIIKKRSVTGIVALTARTFLLQLVAFAATFLLTIFLSPATFGVFYVVSAIIGFLGYFSDIGLAAALIQKKEALTEADLVTTFTIQQILVVILVGLSLVFSGPVASFYRLDNAGLWLLRALIISFFLSSLKTIPSVILERKLSFEVLVIPNILETVGFYTVAVILAWKSYGVASFTWAVLVRGMVGLVAMYIVSPWRIKLGISLPVARRLLRFGIPFQLNSFLALVKDDLLTIYLGKVLPFAEVGYIGWAKKWAEVPLRLIMDSVIRVTFPAFARLQHSPKLLGSAIEKTLFGLSATIFPISAGLVFFMPYLLTIVPRYSKWEPALLSFYLFVVAAAIASLTTPLTNTLNAVGRIKTTLKLMILWTTTTWVLTAMLVNIIGFNGFSLSLVIVALTIVLVVYLVKRITRFSFSRSMGVPFVGVLAQAVWYYLALSRIPINLPTLGVTGAVGVILYGTLVYLAEKEKIHSIWRSLRG